MAGKKKTFDNVNTDLIETVTQATAETPQEELQAGKQMTTPAETLKTIKEKKGARVNLSFTPDNYAYLKIMSQVRGQSLNDFANYIITLSREQNEEKYKKAIEFLQSF